MTIIADRATPPTFLKPGAKPACREKGVNPDWWFPIQGEGYKHARNVCSNCPLMGECGDWAIATNQEHGMWGAMTPDEIQAKRKCRIGECVHSHHWRRA